MKSSLILFVVFLTCYGQNTDNVTDNSIHNTNITTTTSSNIPLQPMEPVWQAWWHKDLLGVNANCYYKDGYVHDNGNKRPLTEEERQKLEEFKQKMGEWSNQIKVNVQTFMANLFSNLFNESGVTMAPWPQMPQVPCFCSSCLARI